MHRHKVIIINHLISLKNSLIYYVNTNMISEYRQLTFSTNVNILQHRETIKFINEISEHNLMLCSHVDGASCSGVSDLIVKHARVSLCDFPLTISGYIFTCVLGYAVIERFLNCKHAFITCTKADPLSEYTDTDTYSVRKHIKLDLFKS